MSPKSIIRFALACLTSGMVCYGSSDEEGRASSPDPKNIKSVITALKQECIAREWNDPMTAMEAFQSLKEMNTFRILEGISQKHWAVILDRISEIASDDYEKLLLLLSFWSLEDSDYIQCQSKVLSLVEKKEISPHIYKPTQSPIFGPAKGFLSRHIQNPVVQDIIVRSKNIFSLSPALVRAYDARLAAISDEMPKADGAVPEQHVAPKSPAQTNVHPSVARTSPGKTENHEINNSTPCCAVWPSCLWGCLAVGILSVLALGALACFRHHNRKR